MARKPIALFGFSKGINLKGDCFGEPGLMRLTGFKFGSRIGALESRGGLSDWDTPTNFLEINGIKRWYDSDLGSTFFVFGNDGSSYGLFQYFLESKTLIGLQADTDFDRHAVVLWVNCDNQLIYIPDGKKDAPYSVKLNNGATRLTVQKLGLNPPTDIFTVAISSATGTEWLTEGKMYKWAMSYSYGTESEPQKYGESALGPIISVGLPDLAGTNSYQAIITAFTGISGMIKRINIYRTLADGDTFYKVGEINEAAVVNWIDTVKDSAVNLSFTAPTYTGLPGAMRCAAWHPTLKRLFWFGYDGYFHWGAAGYADINPLVQRMEVGSVGFPGYAIFFIRNSIYCFKEDGIYLVQGDAPNYFSTKVSGVQCNSRGSVVEMPDGIYFLGSEQGKIKVYKFNGNTAEPITEGINDLLPANKDSVFKRAYAKRVGDEYWISLMVTDKRYCNYPVPYNNAIFMWDYRYSQWAGSLPIQASEIEIFDGPGDSGEVFICESDPTSDSSKGTFFRFEKRGGKVNRTVYTNGARVYTKLADINGLVTYGVVPGIGGETASLEDIAIFQCKVRVRGYVNKNPVALVYDDSLSLDYPIVPQAGPESGKARRFDYDSTTVAAGVVATGQVGTALCYPNFVDDFVFTFIDEKLRTGVIVDVNFIQREGKFLEVEALEMSFNSTNNQ